MIAQDINYRKVTAKKKNYFLLMSVLALIMTCSLNQCEPH